MSAGHIELPEAHTERLAEHGNPLWKLISVKFPDKQDHITDCVTEYALQYNNCLNAGNSVQQVSTGKEGVWDIHHQLQEFFGHTNSHILQTFWAEWDMHNQAALADAIKVWCCQQLPTNEHYTHSHCYIALLRGFLADLRAVQQDDPEHGVVHTLALLVSDDMYGICLTHTPTVITLYSLQDLQLHSLQRWWVIEL